MNKFDKEELSRLVLIAKGSNRTMQQFAAEIGVTPSTLSRIVNMKNETPSSYKVIKSIASFAERDSGVTIEMLLKANGTEEKKFDIIKTEQMSVENLNILVKKISENIGEKGSLQKEWKSEPFYQFDFCIDTREFGLWAFDYKFGPSINWLPVGCGKSMLWISKAIAAMNCNKEIKRVSLVENRKLLYQQMKERLDQIKTERPISIIFISGQTGKILEATSMNMNGDKWNSIFEN